MGYALENQQFLSFQEYESLEASATENWYEFFDGIVYDMAGVTGKHNEIIGNAVQSLRNYYRPRGCRVYTETVKLEVVENKRYVYPDVMVTCAERDKDSDKIKREPVLIIEVLSESTAIKDLTEKTQAYLSIPHLQAYLLVEQTKCWVRVYERDTEGNWLPHWHVNAISDSLTLRCGWNISLTDLYADVKLA